MTNREAADLIKLAKTEIEWDYSLDYQVALDMAIKALEQEPKTGHWKCTSMDKYPEHAKYWYRCDRCGKDYLGDTGWCSNCGYKMSAILTGLERGVGDKE